VELSVKIAQLCMYGKGDALKAEGALTLESDLELSRQLTF
jgi:hypothetical protein